MWKRLPAAPRRGPHRRWGGASAPSKRFAEGKTLPRTEFTSGRGFSNRAPQARDASVGGAAPENGGQRGVLRKNREAPDAEAAARSSTSGAPSQMGRRERAVQAFCRRQNLAADGIYFRPRFFKSGPTGAGRVCGRSCTRERWATRSSDKGNLLNMTKPRCGSGIFSFPSGLFLFFTAAPFLFRGVF